MVFSILTSQHNPCITALKQPLLYIHDYLINAIASQKLSCLCLHDLSAAFDTSDRNNLITRLSSWFGIHGSVLNWFKSYLSFRSFPVKCGRLLFWAYFFLWCSSNLCSRSSTFHHIYHSLLSSPFSKPPRDYVLDFCFLFTPCNFDSSITHPQTTLQQISSWM